MVGRLAELHGPVWLLCCGYADMPALQIEGEVVIHRFKVHHPNLLRRAVEFGAYVHRKLAGLETRPDICLFRDPWSGIPVLAALPEVPAVFEVNGLPSWELPATRPGVARNPCLMAKIEEMERYCLSQAAAVITVSGVTARALADSGVDPARIFTAPNSADEVFFKGGDPHAADLLGQGRWFGYVGSLHPWQGVELLVEAWAKIAGGWPDVRLLVVHNGRGLPYKKLRKKCRKLGLEDRIAFHSPLSPDRLAGVLTRMEFTTAPLTETFRNTVQGCCPIKIVESMAAGTPVAASDLEVNRALVRHGRDGYLIRPGGPREWAVALDALLSDRPLRDRLAEGARQTAAERFTRETMHLELDKAFRAAVSGPSRGILADRPERV
jgi:glycosyltransferase involved in cell wall biosynthesis